MAHNNVGSVVFDVQGKLAADMDFSAMRAEHPLVADLIEVFLARGLAAVEAIRVDPPTVKQLVSEMAELFTWIKNVSPPEVPADVGATWATMVRANVPMQVATDFLVSHSGKGRGKPVSNRLPVVLALEKQRQNPELTWMSLAFEYCVCGKERHDVKCRERLRHKAMELKKLLSRLGV